MLICRAWATRGHRVRGSLATYPVPGSEIVGLPFPDLRAHHLRVPFAYASSRRQASSLLCESLEQATGLALLAGAGYTPKEAKLALMRFLDFSLLN